MRMTSVSHHIEVTGQQATATQPAQLGRCQLQHQAYRLLHQGATPSPTPARPSRHPLQQRALQFLTQLLRSPPGALSVTDDQRASRTNKVQAHRYLFFDKIATDNIQAIVEKWLQANPVAPTLVPMPASQCSSGASSTEATSQLPLTDDHAASERASTLEEHSAIALPLTDDEAEQMDSSATRKRAREQLGSDDEEDGPRKQPVTYPAVPELSNMGGDPSLRLEQTETGGADPVDLGEGAKGQKAKGTHKPVAQRPPLHAAAIGCHFRGASANARFIRVFDHHFDILNSRNHLAKSFKAPLRKQNEICWKSHFDEAGRYKKAWIYDCLLLKIKSTAVYTFLHENEYLPLPNPRTLYTYLRSLKADFGFDSSLFTVLKDKLQVLPERERRGINSDQKQLQTSFQHPCDPSRTVQALIDPPHVFKCIRNNLQKVGKFLLPEGHEVHHFHYSALLEYEEQQAGLRAVPKLTRAHIFPNAFQKISVRLAVQASNHS
ncbi:hypothetical protein MRX96_050948 [Rhipicephalus microplus]